MTLKELLKWANIYQNYSKNKSSTVFLTHSVYFMYVFAMWDLLHVTVFHIMFKKLPTQQPST